MDRESFPHVRIENEPVVEDQETVVSDEQVVVEKELTGMSLEERAQKQMEDEVAALDAQIKAEQRALEREQREEPEVTRVVYVDEPNHKYGKYRSAMVFGDLKLVEGTKKLAKKAGYKFSNFFTAMENWGKKSMEKTFKWGKYIPGLHLFYKDPAKSWEKRDQEEEKKAKKEKGKKESKKKRVADLIAGGFSKEQANAIIDGTPIPEAAEPEEKKEEKEAA